MTVDCVFESGPVMMVTIFADVLGDRIDARRRAVSRMMPKTTLKKRKRQRLAVCWKRATRTADVAQAATDLNVAALHAPGRHPDRLCACSVRG